MTNCEYFAAKILLRSTGLSILDAARLALEATELCGSGVQKIREGLWLASQEIKRRQKSVTFEFAVKAELEVKAHRRLRTVNDIRQITRRLMSNNPRLAKTPIRSLTAQECRDLIDGSYTTPRQRYKARAILSGIFTLGIKRGWCSTNPIDKVDVPILKEKEIRALTLPEIERLIHASHVIEDGLGVAAVGLMIYAGIRPHEITRLQWSDICMQEGVISLRPRHTKTGGTRHVTIMPVLKQLLTNFQKEHDISKSDFVCPSNWNRRWLLIRQHAGWEPGTWQQDCLRHTYASYHAKYFRDYTLLQMEMGHGSAALLRTRYLNMTGITKAAAEAFWKNTLILKSVKKAMRTFKRSARNDETGALACPV